MEEYELLENIGHQLEDIKNQSKSQLEPLEEIKRKIEVRGDPIVGLGRLVEDQLEEIRKQSVAQTRRHPFLSSSSV